MEAENLIPGTNGYVYPVLDIAKITPIEEADFAFGPIQTKWLEALESGNWKQSRRHLMRQYLRQTDDGIQKEVGYCCLGVVCELAGIPHSVSGEHGPLEGFEWDGNFSNGYLPYGVEEKIGLRDVKGSFLTRIDMAPALDRKTYILDEFKANNLAELNDLFGFSFPQIAAVIRRDPHNVFTHSA